MPDLFERFTNLYATTTGWSKRVRDMGDNTFAEVVTLPVANAAAHLAAAVFDGRAFGSITLAVPTAPTAAYTPQWSPDNVNWYAVTGVDLTLSTQSSIGTSFTGAVTFQGGGFFRLNGGTGGVFQISGGQ